MSNFINTEAGKFIYITSVENLYRGKNHLIILFLLKEKIIKKIKLYMMTDTHYLAGTIVNICKFLDHRNSL